MLRFNPYGIAVFLGILCIGAKGDEFPECLNQENGIFLPVNSDCTKAIYCNGIDSSIVECDEQNPYFSDLDKMCYDDITVCGERLTSGNKSTTLKEEKETTGSIRPTTSRSTTAILPTTTIISSTINPTTNGGFITSRPTPTVLSTIPVVLSTQSTISSTITTIANISCPLVDDPGRPLYRPHPQFCSQYYLCYHGFPVVMQCPNSLLFDVVYQSCNAAELVNCQLNSISEPPRHCLPNMVSVYPHPKNCNYYYRCEFGYLKVMQCPFGMSWDYEMAICTQLETAKCYKPSRGYFN